jgi:NitT/TauT family transport system ATP-binding protein
MTDGLRLRIEAVSHAFGHLPVLERVSLTAEPGEVLALVGPSGCGKSTLLGIIGGLIRPSAGVVRIEGSVSEDCLNPLTYVFQDFALLPWRSVAGNIALPLEARLPRAARVSRVQEALRVTGLSELAGMRQRVGIARALAVRPACLLMDEPLSALDAQTRDLLLEEFGTMIEQAGTTTVYVTHNLAEAVRLGHQVAVLSRRPGRVRDVVRIARPISRRSVGDPDLGRMERHLWQLIRDDAAAAERELDHAAH